VKNIASLILCAAVGLAHAGEPELFIRGGFNGWGTDNQLTASSDKVFETRILISPGNHGFKVGRKDWSAEWVIDPNASVNVKPGATYKMGTQAGPEDFLFVKTTGVYLFRLDLTEPGAPGLRVTRLEQAPVAQVDPHRGHAAQASMRFGSDMVRFSTPDIKAPLRSYAQSSTMPLRDPGPQYTTFAESPNLPTVRSGSLAFDALFALATTEMQQASVKQIKDGNYKGGAAIDCDCFETGEKWHYVWTRDLSYAANLGLAMLDPQRVRNSLDFKLSGWRAGVPPQVAGSNGADGLQIIQDTGSGGSWPVSTDRISWAFGAEEVLKTLPQDQRKALARRALQALSNTIEGDRVAAFHSATGLYTGEQSFLDWREQSYASWIVNDIAALASSKALSTNAAHYKGLSLAADLAQELGDTEHAARYRDWASLLKLAINRHFWLEDEGMYSSLTAAHFDGAPLHKFDWLAQTLAITTGVADAARAARILARYPHGPMGAPVIYPQQPNQPIYHNRAIWPFVTAYGLRAAAMHRNVSVADAAYRTLIRSAGLNLSNMENLEWLSGQPLLLDEKNPSLIGPVINSRRQLWSVGAYLGMVVQQVFGVTTTKDGIALAPFITSALRREAFGKSTSITMNALRLRDRSMTIHIALPPSKATNGYYEVESISLNGKLVSPTIKWEDLAADNVIDIRLGRLQPGQQRIRKVTADPYQQSAAVFAPADPTITAVRGSTVLFDGPAANTRYNAYRNGKLAASLLQGGQWTDPIAQGQACYAIEAQFISSGNRSHHSAPVCRDKGIEIAVTDARVASNVAIAAPDGRFTEPRLKNWGAGTDTLHVSGIEVSKAGRYMVQMRYHNGSNQINLGISGGVKWLTVRDAAGSIVAQGVVQLPHARLMKSMTPPVYSTPLPANLKAGIYQLSLGDHYNMSYLQANASFSAAGGVDGPSNRADLFGVRLMEY
jgi:hypothetical protein